MGRPADRVLGVGGGRVAGRRESAHRGTTAPGAQVPRALRLRAPAVRRAEHDQRESVRPEGMRRRQADVRGPAGRPARLVRRQDHRDPVRDGPAHHRPRIRSVKHS